MARRYFQFGLPLLFVAITVIGLWLGVAVKDARRQRDAVAYLREHNWSIKYDYEVAAFPRRWRPDWADHLSISRAPQWLRKWLGDDLFCNVVHVLPGYAPVRTTDADLERLGALRHVKELWVEMTPELSDAGFMHLDRMAELEDLRLFGDISTSALRHFSSLPNLRRLNLGDATIMRKGRVTRRLITLVPAAFSRLLSTDEVF